MKRRGETFGKSLLRYIILIQRLIIIDEEFQKLRKKIDTKILLVFLYSDNFSQIDKESTHKICLQEILTGIERGGGQILRRKKDTRYTSNVSSSWFRAERRVSPFPRASHGRKNRGWREEGGGGGGEDEDGDLEGDETWYNAWMFRFTKIVPFLQRLCCLCQVEFKGCE